MIRIACTVVFCIFAGIAFAEPRIDQISGSFENGGEVQVFGSGFGQKSQGAPILWDDLNFGVYGNLADGDPIPTQYGTNGHSPDTYAPHPTADSPAYEGSTIYRTSGRVPGNSVYALAEPYGWLGPFVQLESRSLYLDWWIRDGETTFESGLGNKILRLQVGPDVSTGRIVLSEGMLAYSNGNDAASTGNSYGKLKSLGGEWTHLAVWMDVSEGKSILKVSSNGQTVHAVDDVVGPEPGNIVINALGLQFTPQAEPISGFQFGDIYVDDTQARVMIGDDARWENVIHYEMQIPTTWEDGTISFTANLGSFSDEEPLYLFVSDADGQINTGGYQVSGALEGPGQPGQPMLAPGVTHEPGGGSSN